ncbi:amino acid adenylation domain-containing protein [Bradyrhizobium sp. USDA 4369]
MASVREVQRHLAELLRHEHAPLALAQRCSGVAAPAPLFSALLNYRHSGSGSGTGSGVLEGIEGLWGEERTNYPLTLSVDDLGGGFALTAQVEAAVGAQRVCAFMATALEGLVEALERTPERPLRQIDVLPEAERHRVVVEWNATTADYPQDVCVHELFEAQAERTPDAVAVVHEDRQLSYAELNAQANRLAHHLRGLGVRPDDRVAICIERSPEMIVGLLAILKAGGAYVPLDPAYPPERLAFMLQDSAPVALLVGGGAQAALAVAASGLAENGVPVLDIGADASQWAEAPAHDPERSEVGLAADHLAYVIYTSGSTGQPKGVMVEHRNVARLFHATEHWYQFGPADVWTLFHSYAFDFSVWEIWGALLYGGRLVVVPQLTARSPDDFYHLLCREGVTVLNQTPSAFRQLMVAQAASGAGHGLRCVIFGGEALELGALQPWYRHTANQATTLINMYGITETTVHVTYCALASSDTMRRGASPIGRPIPDLRVYILDEHGEPAPIGVAGEIYVGGAGVARGYLNRPELTAERFVEDRFSGEAGARLYRTGDLGRWLEDGTIAYLGRNDFQVKIRGFRIELGEIEARLSEHAGVRDAAVIAREDGPGDKRLVAYYVSEAAIGAEELRSHLAARLPDYMVPAAYVHLERLPLTPNGKLDRKALPVPEGAAFAVQAYAPPQGETEAAIARIWSELLGVERIGRHDNFFALGGHSLLAIQVVSRLRQALALEAALSAVFARPTLSELAAGLKDAAPSELPSITPAGHDGALPLSFAQQRLWFLSRFEGANSAYHIAGGLRLIGRLEREALLRALDRIVARHEALRTVFAQRDDGVPVQQVGAADAGFALMQHDLRGTSDAAGELQRLAAVEATAPFDLERGPLIRGRLVRLDVDEHVLLLTMHHIVSDGWSMGVLTRELSVLYGAFARGEADPLPALAIQYADYAVWQRRWLSGEGLARQGAYWKEALSGAPALLELPWDRPRPAEQNYAGAMVPVQLDGDLTGALRALSHRHGTTLYMTLLAGWAALLSRLSGQEDVVIGSPVANRGRAEIEELIGFFVNTLALRVDVSGSLSVSELLARVKAQTVAAQEHQDLPFEQVVELLQPSRSLSHAPLFQAVLAWQTMSVERLDLGELRLEAVEVPRVSAQFDLTLSLAETGGTISGGLEYATALFDRGTVERWVGYFVRLLEGMVADERVPVDRLPLQDDAERHRIVVEWNATAADYPQDVCVHELFEAQAARTPAAVAVVHEDRQLSYAELNAQANRLAHHLRGLGVRPDDRVAICIERSPEMIVGLLAILKAGGAYVPLDPAYPPERLAFMVQDSAPVALLVGGGAQAALAVAASGLAENGVPVLDIGADASQWAEAPAHDPERSEVGLAADHLAYVIYTSGSTGQPKGAMNGHRAVVNRLLWMQDAYALDGDDAVLQKTPFSFDVSVWEFFWPLLAGARLVMARPGGHKDPAYLVDVIRRERITTLHFVPSMLQIFLEHEEAGSCTSVKRVMCSGEALPPVLAARLLERFEGTELHNLYGPTEAAVDVTAWRCEREASDASVPIGRPISNTQIYILDEHGEPVPVGVAGEIHIGGVQVGRGYLNRPELTAERFVEDRFSGEAGARLYRTGDLGRWLEDGTIAYLGRNDFQVKIRGFRIELGEIEARLSEHAGVRDAAVIAREDAPGDKRLVAYYVADAAIGAEQLRSHLAARLPDYMVPSAYVHLELMPLTPNGKLDRKALPAPEGAAFAVQAYAPPQDETEAAIARIWSELLGVERIGRHDNFFALGGHSLLAVTLVERMRREGLAADIRTLFATPSLAALAAAGGGGAATVAVPANLIPAGCRRITLEMLPLVALSQAEIDQIAAVVPGGWANIQDIYPLAPLQEGILFHHLMGGEGDVYLLSGLLGFDSRARLDGFLAAFDAVIGRHDILRTAVLWEDLPEPVQVVLRHAPLPVEEIELDADGEDGASQLRARFDARRCRLDVRRAPLLRVVIARDPQSGGWLLLLQFHHLVMDHTGLEVLSEEIASHLAGEAERLAAPLPFRTYVAQARLGMSREQHEAFFRGMLGKVSEPTAPFGLLDVQGDGSEIAEAHLELAPELAERLRSQARALGVSTASLFHVAFAQLLARSCGRSEVVFGTVLFGRLQGGEGTERALGLFINTLPLRVEVGEQSVAASVREVQRHLAELLRHEHAPLALAQRCSGVAAPVPLFSSLLNYRHSAMDGSADRRAWEGIELLHAEERTNYPLVLSVDDLGEGFTLTAQVEAAVGAARICAFMATALEGLAEALERTPERPLRQIDVLPDAERHRIVVEWNATAADYPQDVCVHELFEAQAERTPDAVAVVHEDRQLSYAELNAQANRLAHHLRGLGVRPDDRVAICIERSIDLVAAELAILKCGAAYVPLDPAYPAERLAFMIEDCEASLVLTARGAVLPEGLEVHSIDVGDVLRGAGDDSNPGVSRDSGSDAYIMYTSGSTGTPKGVVIPHRAIGRLVINNGYADFNASDRVAFAANPAFDATTMEVWAPLLNGGCIVVIEQEAVLDPLQLSGAFQQQRVTAFFVTTSLFNHYVKVAPQLFAGLRFLLTGGERADPQCFRKVISGAAPRHFIHCYGPTETTTFAITHEITEVDERASSIPLGRPISNTHIYILDAYGEPAPIGVAGEIYIGGAGVARGYLNRPELTAERFVEDRFSGEAGARLYRTGDLGRWLSDGTIAYLGRNDFQVKIRGFRIELGEIEARLLERAGISDVAVVAREDVAGDKRLVAYYAGDAEIGAEQLRGHLAARLPDYMVPAAYVHLDRLPLTPNGKLDRKALPAPEGAAFAAQAYEPPQGETEEAIARIWSELLGVERIGRHDNFFALGGHSLLAVMLVARLRRSLDVELALSEIFLNDGISQLADRVVNAQLAQFDQSELTVVFQDEVSC